MLAPFYRAPNLDLLTHVEWLVRVDDTPSFLREEWSVPQREGPHAARLELLRASATD
jgi:hypothetical protein